MGHFMVKNCSFYGTKTYQKSLSQRCLRCWRMTTCFETFTITIYSIWPKVERPKKRVAFYNARPGILYSTKRIFFQAHVRQGFAQNHHSFLLSMIFSRTGTKGGLFVVFQCAHSKTSSWWATLNNITMQLHAETLGHRKKKKLRHTYMPTCWKKTLSWLKIIIEKVISKINGEKETRKKGCAVNSWLQVERKRKKRRKK